MPIPSAATFAAGRVLYLDPSAEYHHRPIPVTRVHVARNVYMQMGNLPRLDTRPRLPPPPPSSSTTPPPSLPSFSIPPSSLRLRYRTRKQLPRSSIPDKRLNFHRQETPFQRTEEATLRRKGTLSRRMTR